MKPLVLARAIALCVTVGAAAALAAGDAATPPVTRYVFGLLRRGPTWTAQRTPATDSIQAGHMANIGRMAEDGVLISAGPFVNGGDLRGVFVFRAESLAAIRAAAARDPALQSRRLVLDLCDWYAPPGIGEPYKRLAQQPGHRDSMTKLQMVFLKRGPRWSDTLSAAMQPVHDAHVAGIFRDLASGALATGGPFDGHPEILGIFVFRSDSATARRRTDADPSVRAGRLRAEQLTWYAAWGSMPGDTLGLR